MNQTTAFSSGAHIDPADLSLYAMQLLAPEQASTIADHLSRCSACREELTRTLGDLALTALTVDEEAPSDTARARLLGQIAREKKASPVPAPVPVPVPQPIATEAQAYVPRRYSNTRSKAPRKGWIAAAGLGWAAAAAISLFAGSLFRQRQALLHEIRENALYIHRLGVDAASARQVMDALTDPSARRVTLSLVAQQPPKGQPHGNLTYNPQKGSLIFLASNLTPPERYKAYELWVIPADNSAPLPAGTFQPDDQGNASVVLPDLPKGIAAKAFGVTIEPDGGSQVPTMPLVLFGN